MDPLSITAAVAGISTLVSQLSSVISRFKHVYKLADDDLNLARNHALLLKEEIRAVEAKTASNYYSPPRKTTEWCNTESERFAETSRLGLAMDESSFAKAMSTARDLLCDIEASFPLRYEPHTWRSRVRYAMKDKQTFAQLRERLQAAESTLHGIVAMEQLYVAQRPTPMILGNLTDLDPGRVSRMVYHILLQQQSTMDKIERGEILGNNVINMTTITQSNPQATPAVIEAKISEMKVVAKQTTQPITKPTKLLPRTTRFDTWGFSAQLVTLPRNKSMSHRAAVHISLLGRMFSLQLRMSFQRFSFDGMLHVRNVVPSDSEIAVACRTGDFDRARQLLASGLAHGSDITGSGSPMLEYAIESGSARLVRLLLEHGADPDMAYGAYNMTALQSSFLRGDLDVARILLTRGADIEHVDSDGYSVLSYLWVVDKPPENSVAFMGLCLANGFSKVNASDSRGWTAFHRAAAVGTPEDVKAFLRLGASLDLRAEWYGWTAPFFAASHDNIEAFQTLVEHSGAEVFEALDGDGCNLLHCCVYFGAPHVLKLVLRSGVDVNQKTLPAPLPEDPGLSYRELTASDIARYVGPNRYQMFRDALFETGRDADLEDGDDIFWDAPDSKGQAGDRQHDNGRDHPGPIYGAEDVDDRWTLLHWASYNGSPKVKELLLLKGADPEHLEAIMLEDNPTILPTSPF